MLFIRSKKFKNKCKPIDKGFTLIDKGFTLIELLITVLIMCILASIAVPSFVSMLERWEARDVRSTLFNSFSQARQASFIHHINVVMCLADLNNICRRDAQDLILIFTDRDDNHQYDANKNTLVHKQKLNLRYGHVYLHASRRHYVKYFGNTGLPRGYMGHIDYCPSNGKSDNMYQISLNMRGGTRFKPNSFKPTDCP